MVLSIQQAAKFRTELLRRGVLLVPVIWDEVMAPQMEKKGFGSPSKAAAALPSIGVRLRRLSSIVLLQSIILLELDARSERASDCDHLFHSSHYICWLYGRKISRNELSL